MNKMKITTTTNNKNKMTTNPTDLMMTRMIKTIIITKRNNQMKTIANNKWKDFKTMMTLNT